jgi:DNA-binding beta-propeller fold protein YncE
MSSSRIVQIALARGIVCVMTVFAAVVGAASAGQHYAVTGQIDGPEGAWMFASLDPVKQRLYVGRTDGILAVDLRSRVPKALPLGGQRVQMVVPVPGSDLVVGTRDKSNSAVLIDGGSGAVRGEVATGRAPETAAFDPASGLVAVMAGSGEVTLIDPVRGVAAGSIAVEGILESGVADGKGRLYINLEDQGRIAVVDIAGRKLVGTYALPGCEQPTGLGFDAQSNLLLSACANHVVKAIDAASGADRGTLDIGSGPDAVLVDSQRRVAFVPCSEGRLAVIGLAAGQPRLLESIPTARGAKTGAVDPTTGLVYLPVGRSAATNFGGRAVPGFAVLVVARDGSR